MTGRPGSALWLLGHELRMFVYKAGSGAKKGASGRGMSKSAIGILAAVALLMHVLAFVVVRKLAASGAPPSHAIVIAATATVGAAFTMMLSSGLRSCVEALFERGDLDLLLSSPLSSRSIFTVRLAAIVAGVASLYLLLLAPFAHAGLMLGQFRLLGIYPVVIGVAALASAAAMLLTLWLVRVLGVRRTRVVAQILGALAGAAIFLLSQVYTNSVQAVRDTLLAWAAPLMRPGRLLGPDSLLWLPGEALLGSPLPVLGVALAGLGAFVLTVRFTHRFFVHGVQQAVSKVAAPRPPAGAPAFNFSRGLARSVIVKEWRLIARDPQLISQVLLQLLFLVPLCGLVFVKGASAMVGIGAALAFLCASLASALAWVIMSAEDAPDLLRAAPCAQGTIRRAKLAAATLPVAAVVALPLLWIAGREPGAGLAMFLTTFGASVSAALIVQWLGRPAIRGDFKRRGKGNAIASVFELLNGIGWAALAYLQLAARSGAVAHLPALIGSGFILAAIAMLLALAWALRAR